MKSDSPIYVLVVEDEFFSRLHAVNLIEQAGYKAIEASNSEEAIAILEARKDIRRVYRRRHARHHGWPQTRSCHPHTLASNRAYCDLRAF
jgi:CheY-like chemotaxis protein